MSINNNDIHDFTDALAAGNLPAVSFLKASRYQDAHAANSDPLDEQTFVVNTINAIEKSGLREKVIVMVGGAPVTQEYANAVGADGYAADASTAVRLAKDLIEKRRALQPA